MEHDIKQLLQMFDEAFDTKSWHGTNLSGSIRGIPASKAARRPRPGSHNIWEIVLHTAYWKYAVRRRLEGGKRGSFALRGSNWFPRKDSSDTLLWRKECALLVREHRLLRLVISRLSSGDLRKKPGGGKVSVGMMIRGIGAHDLYHAGQIQLIKRMITLR